MATTGKGAANVKEAREPIASLISKSEKALQRLSPGSWQHTVLARNLKALRIAAGLIDGKSISATDFTPNDLEAARGAMADMISRTKEAQKKFVAKTSQATLLRNRLAALRTAAALLEGRPLWRP